MSGGSSQGGLDWEGSGWGIGVEGVRLGVGGSEGFGSGGSGGGVGSEI